MRPTRIRDLTMKKLYLLAAILLMNAVMLKAQDTIVMRNGDEVKVKVTEVSDTELKYKLWSNIDGPVYTKKVSDIFMVKYKGGHREVYGNTPARHQTYEPQNNNSENYDNDYVGIMYKEDGSYMKHSDGSLYLDGRRLNETQIKEIFGLSGYDTYLSARSLRRKGKTNIVFGWIEFGIGLGLSAAGILFLEDDAYILAAPGALFFLASQIELPIGYIMKGVGSGRLNAMANSYNRSSAVSDNFSIGFAPTLVSAPDAAGNRSLGLGAGISLHF